MAIRFENYNLTPSVQGDYIVGLSQLHLFKGLHSPAWVLMRSNRLISLAPSPCLSIFMLLLCLCPSCLLHLSLCLCLDPLSALSLCQCVLLSQSIQSSSSFSNSILQVEVEACVSASVVLALAGYWRSAVFSHFYN